MLKGSGLGTLGRDSELRYTPNGDAVLSWTMAFNTGFGDKQTTTWLRCSMWGKRTEKLSQYLLKGTKIMVFGTIETHEYQDKEGNTRTSFDMRVDDFAFAGAKSESNGETQAVVADDDDDDLPF